MFGNTFFDRKFRFRLIQVLLDVLLLNILGSIHKAQERFEVVLSTSYDELICVWHQAFVFQLEKKNFHFLKARKSFSGIIN